MDRTLEEEFHQLMLNIYHRAKREADYTPSIFIQMVDRDGGLTTAHTLINSSNPSEGYIKLWERKHLNLTVEAQIIKHKKFHPLFSPDQIETCEKRLKDYGYTP